MVGIIGGGLASNATVDAAGLDAIPSPSGDVALSSIGEGFSDSIGPRLFRQGYDLSQRLGVATEDAFGMQQPGAETGVMLDPEAATARYGIPGVLKFDHPISDAGAKALYDAKHAEALRQDTINRRTPSLMTGQAAQFAYGLVGGLMDPLNLAVGLVPGVGEARAASLLGDGLLGRMGARAIAGSTAGAAGMAALEPLNYGLDVAEGQDWTLGQALRNVAFGGLLGGGLHVLGGAVSDAFKPPPALREQISAAAPETRELAMRGAVAQLADDRPVQVGEALEALEGPREDATLAGWTDAHANASAEVDRRQAEMDDLLAAREARNRGEAPESLAHYDTPQAVDAAIRAKEAGLDRAYGRKAVVERGLDDVRAGQMPSFALNYADPELNKLVSVESPGNMPQTMVGRLRELGGVQDSGGELAARDLDKTPGLVRPGGMPLEAAAVRMAEEGYLPELARSMAGTGPEDVDRIGVLLDALDEHQSGRPRLAEQDIPGWDAAVASHERAKESLREAAEHLGITPAEARGLSRGQLADVLADRGSMDEAHGARSLPEAEGEGAAYEPAEEGEGLSQADAERRWNDALESLRGNVEPFDAEREAVSAAADRAVAAGSAKLADVQAEIAGLEKLLGEDGKDEAVAAAEAGMNEAEAEAQAVQAASMCLMRSGI